MSAIFVTKNNDSNFTPNWRNTSPEFMYLNIIDVISVQKTSKPYIRRMNIEHQRSGHEKEDSKKPLKCNVTNTAWSHRSETELYRCNDNKSCLVYLPRDHGFFEKHIEKHNAKSRQIFATNLKECERCHEMLPTRFGYSMHKVM